ncbi:MAG: ATP synthase F1 subunit gamma [Candidatus Kapaibacterium sp.]|jgi:F-type H+-transporting ATPase subunit gamma
MATLRDIRQRIVSVKSTSKITSAMKMVAAAKLRRAQDAIVAARPYTDKLTGILQNLASAESEMSHPFFQTRDTVQNILIVVVGSDRGLCGGFNSNLFKAAAYYIDKKIPQDYPKANVHVLPVGRRAITFFSRRSNPIVAKFPDVFLKLDFKTVSDLSPIVTEGFTFGTFDRVVLMFNEFKSTIKQDVRIMPLLPIESDSASAKKESGMEYIYEPSRIDILDSILPRYLNLQLWRALLDSNAAEQAARMLAMDNATTNARDLIGALQLDYNKARQASITKEMLEIVGGAEALKSA